MPTYETSPRFRAQWARLSPIQQLAFQRSRRLLVQGLRGGRLDPRLRVKRYRGADGVWELTWDYDGRALFRYGKEISTGEAHVIWLAIGTHEIF